MTTPDDANWSRSSFCGASAGCVDVRRDGDKIQVRDSKFGDFSNIQEWPVGEWAQILDAIKQGEEHLEIIVVDGGVWFGSGDALFFNSTEWDAFVEGVLLFEFEPDRLSSPASSEGCDAGQEVGPVSSGSNLAATGAGAIAVPPVPVAAQPVYILDREAIMDMVERYGDACQAMATADTAEGRGKAHYQADDLLAAIRGALTPLPTVEPEPRWGAGPLVKHNPETPTFGSADVAEYLNPTGAPAALNCPGCGSSKHESCVAGTGSADLEDSYCDCMVCRSIRGDAEAKAVIDGILNGPRSGPASEEIKRRDRLAESWAEDD